jgi:hypothetical protein
MPADNTYIEDSLELNLFFLRIMKEHALFLQLGFTPKNKDMGQQAEDIRMRLDELMRQTIQVAKGVVSGTVMSSGELYTRYTEEAERQTQNFTGVPIDTQITVEEYSLGGAAVPPVSMQQTVDRINFSAASLTRELQQLQQQTYGDVVACRIFTSNYPLVLEHIIAEANDYLGMLERLGARRLAMGPEELAYEEAFWNENMKEHAQFIDGLLDPTETALKQTAAGYTAQFAALTQQANAARTTLRMLPMLTRRTLPAVEGISSFKAQGTNGILSCQVRSVIVPLLSDHQLREANYYRRILRETINQ